MTKLLDHGEAKNDFPSYSKLMVAVGIVTVLFSSSIFNFVYFVFLKFKKIIAGIEDF